MGDYAIGVIFLTPDQKGQVAWLNTLASKVSEDTGVMAQIENNTKEQAMLGSYPTAVEKAVIDSMGAHKDLAMQYLSDQDIS